MELNHFAPTEEQLQRSINVPKPREVSETPLHEIMVEDQLKKLVSELREHLVFAIDLEHHSYRSFMGITCLMQISTVNDDYIIDTLKLRDELHILNEVFTNPKIVKVNTCINTCLHRNYSQRIPQCILLLIFLEHIYFMKCSFTSGVTFTYKLMIKHIFLENVYIFVHNVSTGSDPLSSNAFLIA